MSRLHRIVLHNFLQGVASVRLGPSRAAQDLLGESRRCSERAAARAALSGESPEQALQAEFRERLWGQLAYFVLCAMLMASIAMTATQRSNEPALLVLVVLFCATYLFQQVALPSLLKARP